MSERPLEVGEVGIILKTQLVGALETGDETVVIKGLALREAQEIKTGKLKMLECYVVECKPYMTLDGFTHSTCCIRRQHIRRKNLGDRNDKVIEWKDCIWKPAHLRERDKATIE